jgi:hypothetical protein
MSSQKCSDGFRKTAADVGSGGTHCRTASFAKFRTSRSRTVFCREKPVALCKCQATSGCMMRGAANKICGPATHCKRPTQYRPGRSIASLRADRRSFALRITNTCSTAFARQVGTSERKDAYRSICLTGRGCKRLPSVGLNPTTMVGTNEYDDGCSHRLR